MLGETMTATQTDVKSTPLPTKKRSLLDNLRQLKFNLTAVRADLKYIRRVVYREIKYFIPMTDLFILLSIVLGLIILVLLFFLIFVPLLMVILDSSTDVSAYQSWMIDSLTSPEVIRWAAAIIGIVTILIRMMIKSPINKYRGKVNARKDVTYIFGSSKPAEQFLFEMVHRYGYEERVSLIADSDLLWIRKLKTQIDVYVVEDMKEFEKPNLYEIIGFKNATRVMILTESIELNQNILTNIRQVRPDVEIILLSQYAPNFVFSDLVNDENLSLIEDLDVTVQGLVLSLSLDFDFPQTAEIDIPRTYIGKTGDTMSSDIPKLEVILIRRGDELLPSHESMRPDDRIIVYYYSNFDMKRTNRVVTELPYKKKKKKVKKSKVVDTHEIINLEGSDEDKSQSEESSLNQANTVEKEDL